MIKSYTKVLVDVLVFLSQVFKVSLEINKGKCSPFSSKVSP